MKCTWADSEHVAVIHNAALKKLTTEEGTNTALTIGLLCWQLWCVNSHVQKITKLGYVHGIIWDWSCGCCVLSYIKNKYVTTFTSAGCNVYCYDPLCGDYHIAGNQKEPAKFIRMSHSIPCTIPAAGLDLAVRLVAARHWPKLKWNRQLLMCLLENVFEHAWLVVARHAVPVAIHVSGTHYISVSPCDDNSAHGLMITAQEHTM